MSAVVRSMNQQLSLRRRADFRGPSGVNVHETERAVSVLLGGALLVRGLILGSMPGVANAAAGGALLYRGITGHSYLYQKLGLHTAGGRALPRTRAPTGELAIRRAITIGRPGAELYQLWRDPKVLARIVRHFAEVQMKDPLNTHWSVRGPMGRLIEWDSEIVEEQEGRYLRWVSKAGAPVPNEGSVEFRDAPAGRGTEVHLAVSFRPPRGILPSRVADLLGFVPKQAAYKALWRFKALAETGDILTIRMQPAARNDGRDR